MTSCCGRDRAWQVDLKGYWKIAANIRVVRLGQGVVKPFVTRFQPLLNNVSASKIELERRARVGNDEGVLVPHFHARGG